MFLHMFVKNHEFVFQHKCRQTRFIKNDNDDNDNSFTAFKYFCKSLSFIIFATSIAWLISTLASFLLCCRILTFVISIMALMTHLRFLHSFASCMHFLAYTLDSSNCFSSEWKRDSSW